MNWPTGIFLYVLSVLLVSAPLLIYSREGRNTIAGAEPSILIPGLNIVLGCFLWGQIVRYSTWDSPLGRFIQRFEIVTEDEK